VTLKSRSLIGSHTRRCRGSVATYNAYHAFGALLFETSKSTGKSVPARRTELGEGTTKLSSVSH
jgi:hypothetical protein